MELKVSGRGLGRSRPPDPKLRAWANRVVREISPERLRACVEAFPAPRNRLFSPGAMLQTDELILRGFQEAGWKAERRPFTLTDVASYLENSHKLTVQPRLEGANIVAAKPGEASRAALVVLAHHDTVENTMGADDNTASVAALLELARALAPYRFRRTIIMAATDMEETGFLGARALVSELAQGRRVIGAINFETMAYTSSEPNSQTLPPGIGLLFPRQVRRIRNAGYRGDFTAVLYNGAARRLAASFAAGLAHLAGPNAPLLLRDPNNFPAIGRLLSSIPAVRHFSRSDQVPFWEAGIPAIQITDTADFRYEHYHEPTDTPEKLDYERVAAIVGATAMVVAKFAGLTS